MFVLITDTRKTGKSIFFGITVFAYPLKINHFAFNVCVLFGTCIKFNWCVVITLKESRRYSADFENRKK